MDKSSKERAWCDIYTEVMTIDVEEWTKDMFGLDNAVVDQLENQYKTKREDKWKIGRYNYTIFNFFTSFYL